MEVTVERRLDHLEQELSKLRAELSDVGGRLRQLEAADDLGVTPAVDEPELDLGLGGLLGARPKTDEPGATESVVPLVGRTLLVFGGAYLLRAVTELGALPDPVGVALGLAYALTWIAAGDRAMRKGAATSGSFHCASSLLIVFPLLWEAATRFSLVGALGAAVGLAVVGMLGIGLGARHGLRTPVWMATLGATMVAFALVRALRQPVPMAAAVAVVCLAAIWVSYDRHWRVLPWVASCSMDLGLALVVAGSLTGRLEGTPLQSATLLLVAFAGTLGIFGVRTLLQKHTIDALEAVQALLALILGFGGAVLVSRHAGWGTWLLGSAGAALGLAAYAVAFAPTVRFERRRNFFFYTTLGFVLLASGSLLILPRTAAAIAFAVLAIASAWWSGLFARVTLGVHSALYVLAALATSGLVATVWDALVRPQPPTWAPVTPSQAAVLVAGIICLVIPTARTSRSWGRLALVPRAGLLLATALAAAGSFVWVLAPLVAGGGETFDAGALASLRTAVLATTAVVLALLSRRDRLEEAAWLAYPLLALAGLKVLLEDLPAGRPLTLFVSLAFLGVAIMAAAHWVRRPASRPTATSRSR